MKTMKVRGHVFTSFDEGCYWSSSTTFVDLYNDDEACMGKEWRACRSIGDYVYDAEAPTAESAFDALKAEVQKFCDEVMKNFEERT